MYFNDQSGNLYRCSNQYTSLEKLDTAVYSTVLTTDEDGFLYWIGDDLQLVHYNSHTKKRDSLGKLNYAPGGDFVFWNHHLIMAETNTKLIDVNISIPGESKIFMDSTGYPLWGLANISNACNPNYILAFTPEAQVLKIDMIKKTIQLVCEIPYGAADAASINESGGNILSDTLYASADSVECKDVVMTLAATGGTNAKYVWDDGSKNKTRRVNQPGKYWVTTRDSFCYRSDTINCTFIQHPEVYLPGDTVVCAPGPLLLQPKIITGGSLINSYIWQSGLQSEEYSVSASGVYKLHLSNACGDTTEYTNVLFESCNCSFILPGGFTPNNDRLNDIFKPTYKCDLDFTLKNYRFTIFNRLGQIVFSSVSPNVGWNGLKDGQPQQSGTYIWQIQYNNNSLHRPVVKSGLVTLIR